MANQRIEEPFYKEGVFGLSGQAPMLDPGKSGGQWGPVNNLKEFASDKPYVNRPVIAILLRQPAFFDNIPDGEFLTRTLRNLIERRSMKIEGLKGTIKWAVDDTPLGAGGQFMKFVTDAKMDRSDVTHTYLELEGMPIANFHSFWGRYGLMDPDLRTALANTLEGGPTDWLPDQYTMSVLYFEPDSTNKKVVKSWIGTNLFPETTGEIDGGADKNSPGTKLEHSIMYGGAYQFNLGGNVFAQSVLDLMNFTNANPMLRSSFITEINPNIRPDMRGYNAMLEELIKEQVGP